MSNPSAPVEAGSYVPESSTRIFKDMEIEDDIMYIAANDGLCIFFIAQPLSPGGLSYIEITGVKKLVKDGNYCFLVQEPSSLVVVNVFDISNP
jgi:hypothetical protein